MKISNNAIMEINKLFKEKEEAIVAVSIPIDRAIDSLVRGLAHGMGVDLNKKVLQLETMEFVDKTPTPPPPPPAHVNNLKKNRSKS